MSKPTLIVCKHLQIDFELCKPLLKKFIWSISNNICVANLFLEILSLFVNSNILIAKIRVYEYSKNKFVNYLTNSFAEGFEQIE